MASALQTTFAIGAILTGDFNHAVTQAQAAISGLQGKNRELSKTVAQISSYQKYESTLKQNSDRLNFVRARMSELDKQMRANFPPSKQMQQEWQSLNRESQKLESQITKERTELESLGTSLKKAGIDTGNLTNEQKRLQSQSSQVIQAQDKLTRAQERYNKTRESLRWSNIKGEVIASGAILATLGAPVKTAMDFELASARLNAVAFSGAGRDKEQDAKEFAELQEQARQLGRDTIFSAVQAANAQENLARAGFKTDEIIATLPGVLDMAAVEGIDLATASDILASSLRGFGLDANNANRVTNILAQTSASTNSSISGLGESFKMAAPLAAGLGISIEETAAMLGKIADSGIKGSQAGNALKSTFARLSEEPAAVAKALSQIGVSSRDAQGRLREIPDLMQSIYSKIKNMGEADQVKILTKVFGKEAAPAMLAVMNAAVDGTLQAVTRLNRESSGQLTALSENTGISLDVLRAGMIDADKIARQLGVTFGDLSTATTLLAQSGIQGAEANEALTQAFTKLANEPVKVRDALKQFNVSVYDSKGVMRDFPAVLQDLGTAMKDFSPPERLTKLSEIFGAEGGRAVDALIAGMNAGDWSKLSGVVDKAQGISGEMAAKIKETLWGQIEGVKSAISGLADTIGDVLLPAAKEWVAGFTQITQVIGQFAVEHPKLTEGITKIIAAIGMIKVAKVGGSVLWNAIRLPVDAVRLFTATADGIKAIGGGLSALPGIAGNIAGAFGKLPALFSALMSPTTLWVAAISGVVTIAYEIYKHWDDIKAWWDSWVIPNVFEPVYNWAVDAVNSVKGIWEDFCNWLSSLNPFAGWTAPTLPKEEVEAGKKAVIEKHGTMDFTPSYMKAYATGGIIARPEVGLIGEAGREAVIPLENNRERGVSLWTQAGQELGMFDSNSGGESISNVTNNSNTSTNNLAPTFNITINNAQENIDYVSIFRNAWEEFQNQELRVSFA